MMQDETLPGEETWTVTPETTGEPAVLVSSPLREVENAGIEWEEETLRHELMAFDVREAEEEQHQLIPNHSSSHKLGRNRVAGSYSMSVMNVRSLRNLRCVKRVSSWLDGNGGD